MLPLGQTWLIKRLRIQLTGLCTGASFTNIELHYSDSNLYYELLKKINSIPENESIFDTIRQYLDQRHKELIKIKEELLRKNKSIDRSNLVEKKKFYQQLEQIVNQRIPFPITMPYKNFSVEELRKLAEVMDRIFLHQSPGRIRKAVLFPRNQRRNIHQEIMYLFNPDLAEIMKPIACYPHVLPANKLNIFFSTLSKSLEKSRLSSSDYISISFHDQTHMIAVRLYPGKGWELADINRGKSASYSDKEIGKEIIKSLPHSRQSSKILFSCEFYAPIEQAEEVEKGLAVWRKKLTNIGLNEITYETANFKVIDIKGQPLSWLEIAVQAQDIDKIIELLNHIEAWGDYKHLFPAIFHLAIKENKKDLVVSLLDKGVSVSSLHDGRNAFHLAAAYGQKEILPILIDGTRGINLKELINRYDEEGYTPLAIAVEEKSGIASQLLEHPEVLLDMKCKNAKTVLSIAIENLDYEMVATLLKKGANPNKVYDDLGQTPLHLAVQLQDIKLVKMLVENGAVESDYYSISKHKNISTVELAKSLHDNTIIAYLSAQFEKDPSNSSKQVQTAQSYSKARKEQTALKQQPVPHTPKSSYEEQLKERLARFQKMAPLPSTPQSPPVTREQASTMLGLIANKSNEKLITLLETLSGNIAEQKNGRTTIRYSQWKIDLFATIRARLEKETDLTSEKEQQYIAEIREACAKKRNGFHFWSKPHSVDEFESLLAKRRIS